MRLFTLYIGTDQPGAESIIIEIIGKRFESFTVLTATGCFRGKAEPAWLVKLATNDVQAVIELAGKLREVLCQDGIGIEYGARYYRCTVADPHVGRLSEVIANESKHT